MKLRQSFKKSCVRHQLWRGEVLIESELSQDENGNQFNRLIAYSKNGNGWNWIHEKAKKTR